jgi:hypothetical protein
MSLALQVGIKELARHLAICCDRPWICWPDCLLANAAEAASRRPRFVGRETLLDLRQV